MRDALAVTCGDVSRHVTATSGRSAGLAQVQYRVCILARTLDNKTILHAVSGRDSCGNAD